ncbi:MAG TPA: formylglycine-generating enzyme family protein [Acetobacteraceae bacterium]|nr:formylglycine-generating enzyme family protein [Acetobacteraceae bacterium]
MSDVSTAPQSDAQDCQHRNGMRWIAGGSFRMGCDLFYPEECPAYLVSVNGFWMDEHEVSNADFEKFIAATGYVTVAERPLDPALYPGSDPDLLKPGAAVFHRPFGMARLSDMKSRWSHVPGAGWRHPEGPGSTILGREREPVVQVVFEDASAYAAWAGKELPTEAEWEFAARGGLEGALYCWGEDFNPGGRWMANTWQGEFPYRDEALDGFAGRSPVGSFPPNGYGLYDMAGNVWEWTTDWYCPRHAADAGKSCCTSYNPRGGSEHGSYDPAQPAIRIPRKVIKGGSYLCAPNYCRRYRPAARYPQMIDTATCHIGFRCIMRAEDGESRRKSQ